VSLGRVLADDELGRDLGVGEAARDQRQDLATWRARLEEERREALTELLAGQPKRQTV
jgi:hypothetical protein